MKTLTVSDIVNGLKALGVRQGFALEVHCSLSKFGFVEGGADAMIDALIEAVGKQGAIVMPSFLLSPNLPLTEEDKRMGLTMKVRILREDEEPTAMGLVSDTFRKRSDVITGEGLYRVSAWGKDADEHAKGFGRIIDNGGYALLLGVDIYKLSAMHYVEDALPDEISRRFKPCDEARTRYPEGEWMIEAWSPAVRPWYKIQDEAYSRGLIADGVIGDAKCMLLKVKPVIEIYRQALLSNALELYGLA